MKLNIATVAIATFIASARAWEYEGPDEMFAAFEEKMDEIDAFAKSGKMGGKSGKSNKCQDKTPTLHLSEPYQPLQKPHQIDGKDTVKVTLTYDVVDYVGPSYNTTLRLYNGSPVGPTIRVKPGNKLIIDVVNCLEYPVGNDGHNTLRHPNITNLHTHGPHISGEDPGDNPYIEIYPQETHRYEYYVGEDHMPGTMWYHPHHHGATALQTGQGAAGLLIIDEPDDYDIPDYISDMEEVQMVLEHLDITWVLQNAAIQGGDLVTTWTEGDGFFITNATTDIPDTHLMLANMQFLPLIDMDAGKWYRFRIAHSSVRMSVAFAPEGDNCEMQLLAKDGIFLNDAPRDIPQVILSPGNRADVAIKCNEPGYVNMKTQRMGVYDCFPEGEGCFPEDEGLDGLPPVEDLVGTWLNPAEQPVIFLLNVKPTMKEEDAPLAPFDAPRPCYLVDLTSLGPDEIDGHFTNYYDCEAGPEDQNAECGVAGPYGIGGNKDNIIPFQNADTYINDFATGSVQEIDLLFHWIHPYHQHVNSYQIQSFNGADDLFNNATKAYYKVGDWHDVITIPIVEPPIPDDPKVTIRFQADQFTGHMVQHCHLLFHEDRGMMANYDITGEEGGTWDGAKKIDPTCIPADSKAGKSSKAGKTGKAGKSYD